LSLQTVQAGKSYSLVLIPKEALTRSQMAKAVELLKQNEAELRRNYGLEVDKVTLQPTKITLVFKAKLMIQIAPIIWAIIGLLGLAGIIIIGWQTQQVITAIPWELILAGVALMTVGLVAYSFR
jgi:hypothetical protein